MTKEFFTKTENGTEYRIYMFTLSDGGFPVLVRSAFDAAEGVHKELCDEVNEATDSLELKVLGVAVAAGADYEAIRRILAQTARRAAIMVMKSAGWELREE